MKNSIFFLLLSILPVFLWAQAPLSDRLVSYHIKVRLDAARKTLYGSQIMTWRNTGGSPVNELQFHLYLNAFRDEKSTFMRESGGEHRGFKTDNKDTRGHMTIKSIRQTDGLDLRSKLTFIQPDDGNPNDFTVASLALPQPVPPGKTISLEVTFEAKLPKIFARTGWATDEAGQLFFMVAQWFPKFGVYEQPGRRYVPMASKIGQWNTHQFHSNSEFYADFGTYKVEMTVPKGYLIGATGRETGRTTTGNQTTFVFEAQDVHDFAWTASRSFREFTTTWKHVKIRALVQENHATQGQRHLAAAQTALSYFDRWYGMYPYDTLTLVDALSGANGMEYPTLITCGTSYAMPTWSRFLELVTVHEFGHQFWYGLLASNEFEESWLDEGINSYTEHKIMDAAYGGGSAIDFPTFPLSDGVIQRLSFTLDVDNRCVIVTDSWKFASDGAYRTCSYAKPGTMLSALEGLVGEPVMQRILRTYVTRWRFKHPTTRDFMAVAEEVSGQSLRWFFQQYLYSSAANDYAVGRLEGKTVWLQNLGEGFFPQNVRFELENGETVWKYWEGRERWKSFTFSQNLRAVQIDPQFKNRLDLDRLNNQKTTSPDKQFTQPLKRQFLVWIQQWLALAAGMF
ncbi:MAG: M1 family metallopeptidase [Rhodothermia bacterium]|nr:M1 family metallopeptidase [Rhodothermia bacterium]